MTKHDAIKHLAHKIILCKTTGEGWADCVNVDALEMATQALQERKKGEWLKPTGLSQPICSECHSYPNLLYGLTSKFCPNCGAEMEENDVTNKY